MPEKPLISVCIANYNGEKLLKDCVDSVLAQLGDLAVEILIHDDASPDNSLLFLEKNYPSAQYPMIRILMSKENVGFCISNNRLAEAAQGQYLLLLNNDAALAPNALATLYDCAQGDDGIWSLAQYDWESGVLVDCGNFLDAFYNPVPNQSLETREVAMVIGACLWLPRRLWQELGGFPEWFESIGEDLYLCSLARLRDYPVKVTSKSFYRHRQGQSFGGNKIQENKLVSTYRRRRLSERNKTFVLFICSPPLRLWLTLPLHLFLLLLEGLLFSLLRLDSKIFLRIYLNVFTSLFLYRTKLWQERQKQQKQRRGRRYHQGFVLFPRKLTMILRYGLPKVK
jgi:GT2 family glycosyltransferase